jgi:hypothetical protein
MSSSLIVWHIIHSSNPDLNYIRNPERKIKLCLCPSTSWKLASEILLYYLFFHPPTWLGHADNNRDRHTYISVWGGEFCQICTLAKLVCKIVVGLFLILLKLNECQVSLPNWWDALNSFIHSKVGGNCQGIATLPVPFKFGTVDVFWKEWKGEQTCT